MRTTRKLCALLLVACAVTPPELAHSSETVTYEYDARGRLVKVSRTGTVNNGIQATYGYDKADNRTNVTVAAPPPPNFSINDVSVTEGGTLVFTVTRGGSTSAAMNVNYVTSNGTATVGTDYTAASGTLAFAIYETVKSVSVATIDNTINESAETVNVTLSAATGGATISDATGVGTINDNDAPPVCGGVSFIIASNAAVTEGANSVYTITKSGAATGSCSVNYATANGTAAAGSDYTAASGTLTFTSAQTSQTVSVATIDDAAVESAETVSMNLSSPTGGSTVGSPGSATATINDNEVPPGPCSGISYTVNDRTVVEGAPLVFTVSRAGSTASSCSVNYATANGTATTPTHYAATSGTLTFTAAQTSRTVTVTTVSIGRLNGTLKMYLNLSSPNNGATIADSQGMGSITADGGGGCPLCRQTTEPESNAPPPTPDG